MISDKTKKKHVDPKFLSYIAEGLHHEAEMWRAYSKDDTLFAMNDTQFTESILTAFDLQKMVHKEVRVHKVLDMLADRFDAIADLIDRTTCTIVCECDAYSSWGERIDGMRLYELSCGHQAVGFEKPRYCQECGMEVVKRD